ncbi:hypothetical protein DTO212C5_2520 [Paecilomyces variotii]|nr:hypothetical protein DTO212C5_2520 [Paecilomyces variotii]
MKPLAAQKQLLLKPMHLLSHPRANQHRDHRCDLQCRSIQANHNALFGAESKSAMSSTYSDQLSGYGHNSVGRISILPYSSIAITIVTQACHGAAGLVAFSTFSNYEEPGFCTGISSRCTNGTLAAMQVTRTGCRLQ